MNKLKMCPFCGSTNVRFVREIASGCAVHCFDCGARGAEKPSEMQSVQEWNRRTVDNSVENIIAAVERMLAYRDSGNATGFQLEKADDFFALLREGLDDLTAMRQMPKGKKHDE